MRHASSNSKSRKLKTPELTEVAAGLVFRDGKLLITQRLAGAHLGGMWEFPGGKRVGNESFEECLVRELREELGIEVAVGKMLASLTHAYPEKKVHLQFFLCRWMRPEPEALGCAAFKWISVHELADYQFPAADRRVIDLLRTSPQLLH